MFCIPAVRKLDVAWPVIGHGSPDGQQILDSACCMEVRISISIFIYSIYYIQES